MFLMKFSTSKQNSTPEPMFLSCEDFVNFHAREEQTIEDEVAIPILDQAGYLLYW